MIGLTLNSRMLVKGNSQAVAHTATQTAVDVLRITILVRTTAVGFRHPTPPQLLAS